MHGSTSDRGSQGFTNVSRYQLAACHAAVTSVGNAKRGNLQKAPQLATVVEANLLPLLWKGGSLPNAGATPCGKQRPRNKYDAYMMHKHARTGRMLGPLLRGHTQ